MRVVEYFYISKRNRQTEKHLTRAKYKLKTQWSDGIFRIDILNEENKFCFFPHVLGSDYKMKSLM